MDDRELRSRVLEALAGVAPDADLGALTPEVSFHDQIDMDSVDHINLMLALERSMAIRIPEADYPRLSTLDGCVRYLTMRLAALPPSTET
jgi:acyl carrier protein